MADTKISDLSAITTLAETDELVVASGGLSKKVASKFLPGYELDYAEITSSVTVSATAAASADAVVTTGARSYDGSTSVLIEFFSPSLEVGVGAGAFLICNLFDGSTDLGRICAVKNGVAGSTQSWPGVGMRRLTPSNASHTYNIKAWRITANGTVNAGTGGTDTTLPAFIRVTKV